MTFKESPTEKRSMPARMLWTFAAVWLCLLLWGNSVSQAQLITGSFSGIVQDQTGAVVSKATVTLTNQGTKDSRKTLSNDSGYFTFAGVNPGTYSVFVEAQGFKSWKQSELTLNAGDSREISGIQLIVGSSSESVEVAAASQETVPTDNGERSAVISTHDIERLSIESRNASELLKILPGVTSVANGTGNGLGFDFSNASSTGSAVGVGLSTNGAPYRGGTAYILDGANIIDPGCNCWSIAVVNPDMTQEVKIQTSNFGADSANGPVIVNSISKSGSAEFHGQGYLYARNGVLNSNLWENNHNGVKRTGDAYYYPGGNIGGPVRIPGTDFNKNNKLLFWAGYEYFWQNLGSSTIFQSWVPSDGMKAGNFTANGAGNSALCPTGFSSSATNWCNDLSGAYGPDGSKITDPSKLPVDAGAKALMSLFPAANVDPATHNGYNYYSAASSQHNGYVWRARVDYNLNDNTKLFVSFQEGNDTNTTPAHIWWNPTGAVPYPGGAIQNPTTSRVLTGNMLNIISPTLTNEFVVAWGWVSSPMKPTNVSASAISTIGYPYGTVFNGSKIAPGINSAGTSTFPDMSQPDIWSSGGQYPVKKATPSFTDNVTKVYKNHTFKLGAFTELVSNYQGSFVNYNGMFTFGNSIQADAFNPSLTIGSGNPTANLVMGIAKAFTQTSSDPLTDMAYRTIAAYVMDDWKVFPRLTVNIGFRFDHIGRWYDRSGEGMAVWLPGRYENDLAAGKTYPGVSWHGIEPGIPNSGSPTRTAYTSPRFGMAYDLFGKGKTVLRGGWGQYRWNDQYNDYGGPLGTAQMMKTYNSPTGNMTFAEIGALGSSSSSLGSVASTVSVADPKDFEIPATYAYNFTISQQMPWRTLLEVAYVGNNTKKLLMGGQSAGSAIAGGAFINQNKIALGAVFKPDPVTGKAAPSDPDNTGSYNLTDYYPYYKGYGQNSINMLTHVGYSSYNGLQLAWVKQTGRLSFNVNYTWSKSMGIVNSTLDAFSVHGNYGILNIDRPHVINTSYAYDLKKLYHGDSKILGGVANNWTISGITTWQSGGNLQALSSQNLGLSIKDTTANENITSLSYFGTNAQTILLKQTCDPKSGLKSHQLINVSCFAPPTLGQQGIRQFPYLSGPGYNNTDLTVFKSFNITERQKVEFRAAAFNVFNHPLWKFSSNNLITPSFSTADRVNFASTSQSNLSTGQTWGMLDAKTGRRLGELSVKYSF